MDFRLAVRARGNHGGGRLQVIVPTIVDTVGQLVWCELFTAPQPLDVTAHTAAALGNACQALQRVRQCLVERSTTFGWQFTRRSAERP
jgi:hypothetical protein